MTLWTVTRQAPLSMGFSRQEYWSGLPFPPPGDLPNRGIKPVALVSLALQAYPIPAEAPMGTHTYVHSIYFVGTALVASDKNSISAT